MDQAAGSSRGSLQPGCVVEEPCVSGSVCHCGGPLQTGLRCFGVARVRWVLSLLGPLQLKGSQM